MGVSIPPINSSPASRDPKLFPSDGEDSEIPPGAPKKINFEWLLEHMNNAQHDKFFNAVSRINDHVFRSRPAGAAVPATPKSWTFSVLGDYGSGRLAYQDVVKNVIKSPADLTLTVGDNVYYDATDDDWKKKWDPWMPALQKARPLMPALGDHDIRSGPDGYFKRFPELKGARYYSYDHKGVHFVTVDTNEALQPGSMQYEWLQKDLAKGSPRSKWTVMYLHHPLWSSVPSKRNKDNLAPLLAKYGVDLVLGGHEHWYNRSRPLNDAGTVQVVVGTGGESLVPFFYPQESWSANRQVKWGHLDVEVTPDALVGRYLLRDGSVGDTFSIPANGPTERPVSQDPAGVADPVGTPPVAKKAELSQFNAMLGAALKGVPRAPKGA